MVYNFFLELKKKHNESSNILWAQSSGQTFFLHLFIIFVLRIWDLFCLQNQFLPKGLSNQFDLNINHTPNNFAYWTRKGIDVTVYSHKFFSQIKGITCLDVSVLRDLHNKKNIFSTIQEKKLFYHADRGFFFS